MILALALLPGCVAKLSNLADEKVELDLDCPKKERRKSVRIEEFPYTSYRYVGCGQYVEYRGTCQSTHNRCDAPNRHERCHGSCRVEIKHKGVWPRPEANPEDVEGGEAEDP
jgi:hypothetical protein